MYRGGALFLSFVESWVVTGLAPETAHRRRRHDLETKLAQAAGGLGQWYASLPLREFPPLRGDDLAPYFFEWLDHPTRDEYWQRPGLRVRYDQIEVPALHVTGWYDLFTQATLDDFVGLRQSAGSPGAREQQSLMVGPWLHSPWTRLVGEVDFGDQADGLLDVVHLRWFDRWLKDVESEVGDPAPVRLFVMGENRWRDEDAWPLSRTEYRPHYLHSRGRANSLGGDGTLSLDPPGDEMPDTFVYNPRAPVSSVGCDPLGRPTGAYDQRPVEIRNDVLVYSTEPLAEEVEVT